MGNDNGFQETLIGPLPDMWDAVELGELGTRFHGGGTPSTKQPEYWNGDIAWTTSSYIGDELYLEQCAGYITPLGLKHSSSQLVPRGNLLIGTRVGVGKVAINQFDTAISQDLTGMHVNRDKVDAAFLAYALRTDFCQERFVSATRGTTIKGVPRADLVKIPIPLPPLAEQRRIAAVLNAIQDAIASQEDVIAAARAFKRSLMHRLFTYGPGPVPAVTKETEIGEIPAHWEVKQLGCLADVKGGKRLPKGVPYAQQVTNHPYIRVTDFAEQTVDHSNLQYIDQETHQHVSRYIITSDDVYISIAGTIGLVGTIPPDLEGANLTENAARIVIVDKITLDKRYLAQWLAGGPGQAQIQQRATKTSQPKLALMRIKEIPLAVPSVSEQTTIAQMLDSVSAKIAVEEDRKMAVEALFKSMLHELMTGQIRLLSNEGLPLPPWRSEGKDGSAVR